MSTKLAERILDMDLRDYKAKDVIYAIATLLLVLESSCDIPSDRAIKYIEVILANKELEVIDIETDPSKLC